MKKESDLNICFSEQQDSSSSDEDIIYLTKLNRLKSMQVLKIQTKRQYDDQQDESDFLKPKIIQQKKPKAICSSTLMKSKSFEKILTKPVIPSSSKKFLTSNKKTKKVDPVSLFQQTQNAWKSNKFLKSGANNKQGRKLNLNLSKPSLAKSTLLIH